MSSAIVSLRAVSHRFDAGPTVLEGITVNLNAGECVSLVGPSGCGKSTLLRVVAGLILPSEGQVDVSGRPETGFVFQDPTLLPWLTLIDNVGVPLALRGVPKEERVTRARDALARVGLAERADFFPRQLSGGQRMRASLARALAVRPKLLLLDEPFGALDELTRDRLNEDLLRLREQEGWSVLFVTHSVTEATLLSDRICLLAPNPGRLHRIFDVPLAYPRKHDTRTTSAFLDLALEISRELRALTPALP